MSATRFLPLAVFSLLASASGRAGDWPPGWAPFPADSRPPVTFLDGGKTIEVVGGPQGGTRALGWGFPKPADRIQIDLSFAFSAGRGRSLNLWTREPAGQDANLVNLAVNDGVLQQYARPGGWQDVTGRLQPTTDWTKPVWYRLRIVADRKHEGVDCFLSPPGGKGLPPQPTATRRGYRPGLAFGSIGLAFGRLAPKARFRIKDLTVRQGPDLPAPHAVPRERRFTLWDPTVPVPPAAGAPLLKGVRFSVIKPRTPDMDGYNWLHGLAVVWHGGKLWASFGHNKGSENTATEVAQGRVSVDAGKTWGPVFRIASGQGERAVSHGVFLSHEGTLWAFHGSFFGRMKKVHTRAYVLDAKTGAWQAKGVVAEGGFWACAAPRKMADGNWIMAGMSVDDGFGGSDPAAVAISRGDDLTRWDVIRIPLQGGLGHVWGESTVIVDGKEILNIARWGARAWALASVSKDFGRTWSTMIPANLPMAGSKPYAGLLSTGQRYLICTTLADAGHRRSPLTIAVSAPGGKLLRRVYRIRDAVSDGPGESTPAARLSYPYAVEHEGKLYVAYSNDGGRGQNRNSAELAVIPVASLSAK